MMRLGETDLTGLDEYHESATMEGYDEAAYLLGDRHTPAPNDRGGAQ